MKMYKVFKKFSIISYDETLVIISGPACASISLTVLFKKEK